MSYMAEPRFANGEVQMSMTIIDQIGLSVYQRQRIIDTLHLLDKTLEHAREASANCIPRSSLPELPDGWDADALAKHPLNGNDLKQNRLSLTDSEWQFLAELVNLTAVYGKGE